MATSQETIARSGSVIGFHDHATSQTVGNASASLADSKFTYTFENFFHPFVSELLSKLSTDSLGGMLDAKWQESLAQPFFNVLYHPAQHTNTNPVQIVSFDKEIEVGTGSAYGNYNWELFFHVPLTIAVHLSKSQRFAEAQRWFHYIFNPTSNDNDSDPSKRVWKFLAFRKSDASRSIDNVIRLLSTPRSQLETRDQNEFDSVLEDYKAVLANPFQPHVVARTRPISYQYYVFMKYLDNLIAWGDYLFQQDTIESINEATMRYVLAANLLGPRPQRIPPSGKIRPKSFAQLKQNLGEIGNAFVELEGQFPFNLASGTSGNGQSTGPLFGIGRSLYFCLPANEKLLGYWDTVADRLFKIRHCMNIAGVVRPLALFDPPIDPGLLVKAGAAGIDVSSIVNGVNQPVGPVRCLTLIQKALELCNEVRSLGGALLSALEKSDSEHLALMRQGHELKIQEMVQEVRFLQWKSAQESTQSLLNSRATALERLNYYRRLLGLPADPNLPDNLSLDRRELTEENFDEAYGNLVGQYDKALTMQKLPRIDLATGGSAPLLGSGYSGSGRVYLSRNEDKELNTHLIAARDARLVASAANVLASALLPIPSINIHGSFWGVGPSSQVTSGEVIGAISKTVGEVAQIAASWEQDQAGMASRYASYERRADEWLLQYNLAAQELKQIGRQILTSLIAEQIAHHEYLNVQKQIANAQEVDQFLHEKFTNEELYLWMQGEIFRLYNEYYQLAFKTARKAERTMKQELMRSELESREFVKFNYWNGGRQGLLSGEALHLDVKQMELAYYEYNQRELELTRHVSLRQLDPLALLKLKATGTCQVTIPEWLYDRDCPGHYMRRIKNVSISLPSVVGPYTSVNCTLTLLRSSLRKSPLLKNNKYERQSTEDDRFIDYIGASQSIVTSSGSNDSGLFETSLRDERFLPFEGAGAESTWRIDLPTANRAFDYATISDVILHVRYTARNGVDVNAVNVAVAALFKAASQSNLALLFSLRHDFPTEWAAFANGADFTIKIRKEYFPYFAQGRSITIEDLVLYGPAADTAYPVGQTAAKNELNEPVKGEQFTLVVKETDASPILTNKSGPHVFLVVRYTVFAQ